MKIIKIKSIKKIINNSKRYDIQTKKTHNFFANNLLVHNSNIFAFQYFYKDISYISYKTRLRPFVSDNSKFGSFYSMWQEMLEKYSEIPFLVRKSGYNLSFEMYGYRNPILILYDVPLDTALLFGINRTTNELSDSEIFKSFIKDVRMAKQIAAINKGENFKKKYREIQYLQNQKLIIAEDDLYRGEEGCMWYMHTTNNKVIACKCKPTTIEKIHFAACGTIDKHSILTTIINTYEQTDNVNYTLVCQLLLEDFPQHKVEQCSTKIQNILNDVISRKKFEEVVINKFNELNLKGKEKRDIMRTLSFCFKKDDMKKVFNVLKKNNLVF